MRSTALAIAWEFRQRHRLGLLAVAGYVLAIAAIRLLILEPGQTFEMEDAWDFAIVIVVPMTAAFTYLLAMFSFGLSGDLAARQSIYPSRMFTLPVGTGALAGWPMLYGTVVMALLWMVTRRFAVWPTGLDVPLVWPAFAAATLLAWTQALMWMPYGLRGLRVITAAFWLGTINVGFILAITFQASEALMIALLAPQLPLAYLAARSAVARARRGDVPDWRPLVARLGRTADLLPRRRIPFTSAERAQLWFEWRRHGWSLPALVGIVLPFELALLFVAGETPALVFTILLGVLVTPPFMAAVAAATLSKANPHGKEFYGVTPFIATRPMTSAALIAAKLKMTVGSTLAAWLLVLVAIPLALGLSATGHIVIERASRVAEVIGTPRAVVIGLLVISGFVVATWKQLVQTLYIGLGGREWIIKTNAFLLLLFLVAIGPIAVWIHDDLGAQVALWDALPWIPAVLVCFKMPAAAWVAVRLFRSRLVSDRALVIGAAGWLATVLALYALLVWVFWVPLIPRYFLALVAILAVPLARLSATPLALAWNRHR